MQDNMKKELVLDTLNMSLNRRKTRAGLLHHSDRGSQYASYKFQNILAKNKFKCSMSRKGECYDNAVVESFFNTLKTELVCDEFKTKSQARTEIFEYIEVFYNRERLHSSLNYMSPWEYENQKNVA